MKNKKKLWKGFGMTILAMVMVLAMTITVFATAEEGSTIYVSTSDVNVRDSAGTSGTKIAVLAQDTALTVIGSQNDADGKLWYNVSFSDQGVDKTGWIRNDFTTTTVPAGVEVPAETEQPAEETDAAASDNAAGNDQMMDFTLGQIGTITPSEGDGEPAVLPEGFRSVYVRGNGQEVPAWTNDEYYIFYAVTSAGNSGWYLYDSVDGGYVRYSDFMAGSASVSENQQPVEAEAQQGVSKTVVIILAVIIFLLVAATSFMGVKLLNGSAGGRDDEEDDEEDEEEEEDERRRPARRSFFARRDDDDDEEEEDDEEDDEEDEEEEYVPRRRPAASGSQQSRNGAQQVRRNVRPNEPVSRNANGQVVRSANGQAVRTNSQVVRSANGQVVRTNSQVVRNANGQVVRTNGQVVRNANGQIVRTNGQVVRNANGQVVRTQQRVQRQRPYEADEDDE